MPARNAARLAFEFVLLGQRVVVVGENFVVLQPVKVNKPAEFTLFNRWHRLTKLIGFWPGRIKLFVCVVIRSFTGSASRNNTEPFVKALSIEVLCVRLTTSGDTAKRAD